MFVSFLNGAILSSSLIIAIGAQNVFVLQQGLMKNHIFVVCFICFVCDAILMACGIFGIGGVFAKNENLSLHQENIDLSMYRAGITVQHKKFGEGVINSVEQEGDDLKLDINFEKVGHKRLMAKYANLEII